MIISRISLLFTRNFLHQEHLSASNPATPFFLYKGTFLSNRHVDKPLARKRPQLAFQKLQEMTRFIPSFLQKRLLRFIVSKIDWIDADAFDLDSLDLSWGIWELKDVPLKVEVLSLYPAAVLRPTDQRI